ncbi:MAG: alpha-galactosidase, partial [Acidobacteriota bacterium]
VSSKRFPDGLKRVKDRLDRYGMKLGLWFGPASAAVSSRALQEHRDCIVSWHGVEGKPHPIWGTEASYRMCLASRYADSFAERLIQLSKEVGVTYFKWDALGQYGCDSPRHEHGDQTNTPEERAQSYAFQMLQQMIRMADRIAAACPGAIVDFDVTEAGRAVGLGFLSAGRFFLINNGPYYASYDVPRNPGRQNSNLFFYPGAARTWICRSPLAYDKWIPSILFLTHYFPDDPRSSQEISLASLILGQNGIWGDLPGVSASGVRLIGETLARYKQVWNDMAEADPVVVGEVSGSPEIHEKISTKTGRGAVAIFAPSRGKYSYVTSRAVSPRHWASEGIEHHIDGQRRARLEITFDKPGAKIVFFGVG